MPQTAIKQTQYTSVVKGQHKVCLIRLPPAMEQRNSAEESMRGFFLVCSGSVRVAFCGMNETWRENCTILNWNETAVMKDCSSASSAMYSLVLDKWQTAPEKEQCIARKAYSRLVQSCWKSTIFWRQKSFLIPRSKLTKTARFTCEESLWREETLWVFEGRFPPQTKKSSVKDNKLGWRCSKMGLFIWVLVLQDPCRHAGFAQCRERRSGWGASWDWYFESYFQNLAEQ